LLNIDRRAGVNLVVLAWHSGPKAREPVGPGATWFDTKTESDLKAALKNPIREVKRIGSERHFNCSRFDQKGGANYMLISAAVALLFIIAMFLSMLSSSPKDDSEWNPDTEA
jgi:hypothetical protein